MLLSKTHTEGKAMVGDLRLVLRLSSEQAALIRRAADVEGRSITDFIVAAAMAHAQDVLGRSADHYERSANVAILQSFALRTDGSSLPTVEVTEALDSVRAERMERLAGPNDPS
jgi:uncharacterized protein (DUF1778 family)